MRLAYTFIGSNQVTPWPVSDSGTCFPFIRSPVFFRTIVETLCMSGHFFAFQNIKSESRLRFFPVMITRLLLSLKKAGASQEHGWSFGEPTTHITMKFAERRGGDVTRDEIHLDIFASTHEGNREWWCEGFHRRLHPFMERWKTWRLCFYVTQCSAGASIMFQLILYYLFCPIL